MSTRQWGKSMLAAFAFCCVQATAQPFEIQWYTFDGGGGACTGGAFAVRGTIGQPDVGTAVQTGGDYALTGGFWSLVAVQMPGAPRLSIVPAGPGLATISWAPAQPDFRLQESSGLVLTNWVNSASGVTNPVTVPVPDTTRFYRLLKP